VYRLGIVTRTDTARCRVKVRFPARDDVESWWLDVLQLKTHRDKVYWVPDVGEHVACFLDEHGEDGVVAGAIYSQADPAPIDSQDKRHVLHDDGTIEEYDRRSHRWLLDLTQSQGTAVVRNGAVSVVVGPEGVTVDADGDVAVTAQGDVTADAAGSVAVTAGTEATVDAPMIRHNSGTGVVTGECICHFTGKPHGDISSVVTAGKE